MEYFRLLADHERYPDAWFLGDPSTRDDKPLEAWDFTFGRRYFGPIPAFVPIQQEGQRVAFSFGSFDMPVVAREVVDTLSDFSASDIEHFPVRIGRDLTGFEILNVVHSLRCVDESRAKVRKWGPEDERPDKVGHYLEIDPLLIDPRKADGHHLFRIWGYDVALIASSEVKHALLAIPDLGVDFQPVC